MEQNQTTLEKLKLLNERLTSAVETAHDQSYKQDLSLAFNNVALSPEQQVLLNEARSPSMQEDYSELTQENLNAHFIHNARHHIVTARMLLEIYARPNKQEIPDSDAEIILHVTKALEHHTPIMMENYKLMLKDNMPDSTTELFQNYRNEILPLAAEISAELETQLQLSNEQNASILESAHSYDGHESFKPIDKDQWNNAAPTP